MVKDWIVHRRPFEYEYEYRFTEYEYEEIPSDARVATVTDVAWNLVSKSQEGTDGNLGAPHCYC